MSHLPIITIGQEFLKQLNYVLDNISYTEWSGLLFYKHYGDITDISNMRFELIGLYPLDIGSNVYTSYETENHSSDIIDIYDKHPEYMDCKIGHIHSHHNMGAFASNTDMQQLFDGIKLGQFDMLLSVIVNNNRDIWAGVAFTKKITYKGIVESHLCFNNKKAYETSEEFERHEIGVEWTTCFCDTKELKESNQFSFIGDKINKLKHRVNNYNTKLFFDKDFDDILFENDYDIKDEQL